MRVFARTPVDLDEQRIPRGRVFLMPERCKGCKLRVAFCPQEVLQESSEINTKGYHYPEVVQGKDGDCVHCEFCTLVCPEFAIFTLEVQV
jgi:2-oxoglutarate ferredoxin oxidoreductase subunit delta